MFKHGTWAGGPAGLRQQKGTLFIITSTRYCKKKWGEGEGWGTAALIVYFFLFDELVQVYRISDLYKHSHDGASAKCKDFLFRKKPSAGPWEAMC